MVVLISEISPGVQYYFSLLSSKNGKVIGASI